MRLAIIGPLPPFRSGVARHTWMLGRALAVRTELLIVSFVRQYPRWLFPGANDRDQTAFPLAEPYCRYELDSLNPLSWRRTVRMVEEHCPDAVVLPWWTVFWVPCYLYLVWAFRRKGIPVHFLCHNVVDHDAGWIHHLAARSVLSRGSGFIVQSLAEKQRLEELVKEHNITVHPHPAFDRFVAQGPHLPPRAPLELLFFGIVRPYKGLEVLLHALTRLEDLDYRLTIAGEFWQGREAALRMIADYGLVDRIELVGRYVSDEEASGYFQRADAVVMPYLRASGSGVLGLAYSYGKPVIASRIPGLEEWVTHGETGLLVGAGRADELAIAIRSLTRSRAREMFPAISAFAGRLTWDSLAENLITSVRSARVT